MTKIIFLGTAGTVNVSSKGLRSSAGIIIQHGGVQMHLDPGAGVAHMAKQLGVNLHHTNVVLVSHNHLNHCNDLNYVIDAMTHGGIEKRGLIMASKSVLQNTENSHPYITRYHQTLVDKIIALEPRHKVGVDLVEVNTIPIEHTDKYAVGFKIYFPGFILGYSSDTKYSEELVESLKGCDMLILNVPFPGKNGKGLNLDSDSAEKIISMVKPRLAVLTHFGLEMLKVDPLEEARKIQRKTNVTTIAARDGTVITPSDYKEYKSPVKGF